MPSRKINKKNIVSRRLLLSERLSDVSSKNDVSAIDNEDNDIGVNKISNSCSPCNSNSGSRGATSYETETMESTAVSEIMRISWKTFRVSPIYNFHQQKVKIYSRKLEEELIAANYGNNVSVSECKFVFYKLLLSNEYDTIKVHVTMGKKKYTGYFIASPNDQKLEKFSDFKHFPLMLVQAERKLLKQVHAALCKFFDCSIQPVHFSFGALITFFSSMTHMYIEQVAELEKEKNSSGIVTLQYRIPGCPPADSISIQMPLASASTVFAVLNHEFRGNISSSQLISTFYERILNHFVNVHYIDFHMAELHRLIFPHFAISTEGWVKCLKSDVLSRMLIILQDFIKLEYIANY